MMFKKQNEPAKFYKPFGLYLFLALKLPTIVGNYLQKYSRNSTIKKVNWEIKNKSNNMIISSMISIYICKLRILH